MDLIGRQIGNYVVKKKLGAGGMGTVYVCEHPLLGRQVALKVLHEEHAQDPSTVERFFNEARAANAIRHPNIVDVTDFGWLPAEPGRPATVYLVMELLEGKSLAAAIAALSIEQAVRVTRQCCRALAASHQHGIVHRDLKPENIFLVRHEGDDHFVKIVDFGIAKLLNPGEGGKTQIGTILGTPRYMSPEQCQGRQGVDHRADVYSLGVVLYEMLTKRTPFEADNFTKLALAHMTEPPAPPSRLNPRVSPELDAIVLHALEKSPADRFQSMDELLCALDDPATHLLGYRHRRAAQPTQAGPRSGGTLILPAVLPAGAAPPAPLHETLQHAAAQIEPAPVPPRRRRSATLSAVAGALLVGATVVALALREPGGASSPVSSPLTVEPPAVPERAPPPPAPAPAAPPPPVVAVVPDAAPAMVTVTIETDPPGATVTRAGVTVGSTPLSLEVPRGAPPLAIAVTRPGYASERRVIATDTGSHLVLALQPVAPERAAPPRRPRRPSSDLKPLEL